MWKIVISQQEELLHFPFFLGIPLVLSLMRFLGPNLNKNSIEYSIELSLRKIKSETTSM